MMRVGHGYDVHRLVSGHKLILGGVEIPWEMGLLGHSDADVLVHAVMDALLGAAGLWDIGHAFPDNDPAYEGIDSMILLGRVREMLNTGTQYYVIAGSTMLALETDDAESFQMDAEGKTIYYMDNLSEEGDTGDLYKVTVDGDQVSAPEEVELIRHLSAYTDEIIGAARDYDPARITRYVITAATLFHKFYNACKIGVDDEPLMQARLHLCMAVQSVMYNVLTAFKITVPESM